MKTLTTPEYLLSKHAEKRAQQRGMPPFVIDLLLGFGDSQSDKHGAEKLYFGKQAKRRLRSYLGRDFSSRLSEYTNFYVVVADDRLITCGHRTKRIQRH